MGNPRIDGGPKEPGNPGDLLVITITDVHPPLIMMAEVEEDGYFPDEVYEDIDEAKEEYRQRVRGV